MNRNTTQTVPPSRSRRHIKLIAYSDTISCYPHDLLPQDQEEDCNYVKQESGCQIEVHVFNYLQYIVCDLGIDRGWLGMIKIASISLFFVMVYCTMLYVIGKHFILPNIVALAQQSYMYGYNFGYCVLSTLLFTPFMVETTTIETEHLGNGSVLFSEMLAALMPMYCVGIAIVAFRQHNYFVLPETFVSSMCILLFGLCYVFEVLFFKMRNDKQIENERVQTIDIHIHAIIFSTIYWSYFGFLLWRHRKEGRRRVVIPENASMESDEYLPDHSPVYNDGDAWKTFCSILNPFSENEDSNRYFLVIISPLYVVTSIIVPVITFDRPINGWCKYLTIVSFLIFPFLLYYVQSQRFRFFVFFVCILVAVLTLLSTSIKKPPLFHDFYAIFGILSGLNLCFLIDCEVDNLNYQLLSYLGEYKPDAVMLITSSISPLLVESIICIKLIDKGHPDMAYGLVVGVSLILTYSILPLLTMHYSFKEQQPIALTANVTTACIFLVIVLGTVTLGVVFSNFRIRKSHAYFLAIMLFVYMVFHVLSACELMHPFGAQHGIQIISDNEHALWA